MESQQASRAVAIVIVHYRDYDGLRDALTSIDCQSLRPCGVWVYDVEGEGARREALALEFDWVRWLPGPNVGYAAAANRLIEVVQRDAPQRSDILLLNADVELDRDHCAVLARELAARPKAAIAGGKLLRPGRRLIDSAGIRLPLHRRPRDRGSEQEDRGQFDVAERVFGISGAALYLSGAHLALLALDGEIFDETFFMYHEDTDLCWRAKRLGLEVWYVPGAVAVHRRGWRRDRRFDTPVHIRRHSFKNHYLQIIKNETPAGFVLSLPALALWEALRLGFALLRDRPILGAYADAWRLRGEAFERRRRLIEAVEHRD